MLIYAARDINKIASSFMHDSTNNEKTKEECQVLFQYWNEIIMKLFMKIMNFTEMVQLDTDRI